MVPPVTGPDLEADVAVLGLGPAGRAMAHRLAAHGVDVVGVDYSPHRRWRPTYAAWADEVPDWVPADVVATETPARAWARREHVLDRPYLVFDTARLQAALGYDGVRLVEGRVSRADQHGVTLTDGRRVRAELVLDARGSTPDLTRAQQTAIGVVVRREQAPGLEPTWFMDWRRDNGTGPGDAPSFWYVVALDAEHLLLEETCLVGRPALGWGELRRRLDHRLAARGVRLSGTEREERVRFTVEPEPPPPVELGPPPVPIGARGGLMHPATGYSVALALRVADELSRAVAGGATSRPAVQAALWPRRARQAQALRRVGLTTLLRLPPDGVADFFEAFFALSSDLQRAYLSDRDRPVTVLRAMASMARSLRPSLAGVAVTSVFTRPRRPNP